MAKPPKNDRLQVDDFKDQKTWIGRLFTILNSFMEQVTGALSRDLTIKDNMAADIMTVEFDGQMPLKLAWSLKARPRAVLVGDVYPSDGSPLTLTGAVFVRWSFNQTGQLQIDQVVGISPSSQVRYKAELVIFTG